MGKWLGMVTFPISVFGLCPPPIPGWPIEEKKVYKLLTTLPGLVPDTTFSPSKLRAAISDHTSHVISDADSVGADGGTAPLCALQGSKPSLSPVRCWGHGTSPGDPVLSPRSLQQPFTHSPSVWGQHKHRLCLLQKLRKVTLFYKVARGEGYPGSDLQDTLGVFGMEQEEGIDKAEGV